MPKPTIATIASKIPRETAGAEAFRAFDFQVNVSIARILDLHREGKQYLAVFDHHDDLILFVGDAETAELSFYQVKSTTELTWTPKRLANRPSKGDLPRSIVGKAYYNVAQFGPGIRRAAILSNRPLNAQIAASKNSALHEGELCFSELCSEDRDILVNALQEDFPGVFDATHTHLLTFERVAFDLESHRATVLGKVVSFLEELQPEFAVCALPLYEALLSAAGDCTGNKMKTATAAELKKRVSLGRDDIHRMIVRVQGRVKNVVEWWPSVQSELLAEGRRALLVERIRGRCLAYWSARRVGERAAAELCNRIRAAMAQTSLANMDSVLDAVAALNTHGLSEPLTELYDLQSAMIVELMESMT